MTVVTNGDLISNIEPTTTQDGSNQMILNGMYNGTETELMRFARGGEFININAPIRGGRDIAQYNNDDNTYTLTHSSIGAPIEQNFGWIKMKQTGQYDNNVTLISGFEGAGFKLKEGMYMISGQLVFDTGTTSCEIVFELCDKTFMGSTRYPCGVGTIPFSFLFDSDNSEEIYASTILKTYPNTSGSSVNVNIKNGTKLIIERLE